MRSLPVARRPEASGLAPLLTAVALGLLVLALAAAAWIELRGAPPDAGRAAEVFAALGRPDPEVLDEAWPALIETLRIALLGTAMGLGFALVLAWAAARSLAPRPIHRATRLVLHLAAAMPPVLVALVLVIALGPGSLAGVIALALHSAGRLALAYADAMDAADRAPVRALQLAGAGWVLQQRLGIWPQIAPGLAARTAERLHGSLRDALLMGLVGAGGIGSIVLLHASAGALEKVAMLMIVVLALVVAMDLARAALMRLLG
ncbi:MAG: ABC transporter permease subunit [Alphaproteobacteria bacterium]|nr:MAG: ABC transporter permease subunit [Alphaproteobacteria bacterium]